ncbi:MAG: hypothetical protein GC193_14070 [Cryomorphaceae bacterium]|nr:hypothetical protein [Cryomorphaceae bacterium]
MCEYKKSSTLRRVSFFILLTAMLMGLGGFGQITTFPEVLSTDSQSIAFRFIPICEQEVALKDKFSKFEISALVDQLEKEDTVFSCPSVRGTTRLTSHHRIIGLILSDKRDEAAPDLIRLVSNHDVNLSRLALDILQHADEELLQPHRNLFLDMSKSKDPAVRNRNLYILQRIKDQKIERTMVNRWHELSVSELKELANTGGLGIWSELIMYRAKDHVLVDNSIVKTLKAAKLETNGLTTYLSVLESYIGQEHAVQIDEEVAALLLKTNDVGVADRAGAVLSDSPTTTARDALIRALECRNEIIRANTARHLVSRSDFIIAEQTQLLEQLICDDSFEVVWRMYSPLTWKKPTAEDSATIVRILLKHLSESKKPKPEKVFLLMYFYPRLSIEMRKSLALKDASTVLLSIEMALNSPEIDRVSRMATDRMIEEMYGEKETGMTHIEFWRSLLEQEE